MARLGKIKEIQRILGVERDGIFGPKSQAALNAIINPNVNADIEHHGKASSFADTADILAFNKCKAHGGSDQECFKVGDNAIGCYGDDVSEGSGASCALPPEDSEERWGSVAAAKHKGVWVDANGKTVMCLLKDRMPHRVNIKNEAVIDLNPDAVKALGLTPPVMVQASWRWV